MRKFLKRTMLMWVLLIGATMVPGLALAGEQLGYDNGFFLRSADDDFMMKTNGMSQFNYNYTVNDGTPDTTTFAFNRARLALSGHAFGPDWSYFIQSEWSGAAVVLLDYFVNYAHSESVNIKFGNFRIPFNREFQTEIQYLQTIGRNPAQATTGVGRELGVSLWGHAADKMVEYYLTVSNGNGSNTANPAGTDIDFRYTGRVVVHFAGDHGYWYSDINNSEETQFALGAGVNYNKLDTDSDGDFDSFIGGTADVIFASNGFSAGLEYHILQSDFNGGGSTTDHAVNANVGYFVSPDVEIAAHANWLEPDAGATTINVGPTINYYLHGQNARLALQYDYTNVDATPSTTTHTAQAQFQFMF